MCRRRTRASGPGTAGIQKVAHSFASPQHHIQRCTTSEEFQVQTKQLIHYQRALRKVGTVPCSPPIRASTNFPEIRWDNDVMRLAGGGQAGRLADWSGRFDLESEALARALNDHFEHIFRRRPIRNQRDNLGRSFRLLPI